MRNVLKEPFRAQTAQPMCIVFVNHLDVVLVDNCGKKKPEMCHLNENQTKLCHMPQTIESKVMSCQV